MVRWFCGVNVDLEGEKCGVQTQNTDTHPHPNPKPIKSEIEGRMDWSMRQRRLSGEEVTNHGETWRKSVIIYTKCYFLQIIDGRPKLLTFYNVREQKCDFF